MEEKIIFGGKEYDYYDMVVYAQDYSRLVVIEETGMDTFGEKVSREIIAEREMKNWFEELLDTWNQQNSWFAISSWIENAFENQKENIRR